MRGIQQCSVLSLQLFCKSKSLPKLEVFSTFLILMKTVKLHLRNGCVWEWTDWESESSFPSLPSCPLGSGRRIPSTDANPPSGGKGFKLRRQPSEPKRSCCWLSLGLQAQRWSRWSWRLAGGLEPCRQGSPCRSWIFFGQQGFTGIDRFCFLFGDCSNNISVCGLLFCKQSLVYKGTTTSLAFDLAEKECIIVWMVGLNCWVVL